MYIKQPHQSHAEEEQRSWACADCRRVSCGRNRLCGHGHSLQTARSAVRGVQSLIEYVASKGCPAEVHCSHTHGCSHQMQSCVNERMVRAIKDLGSLQTAERCPDSEKKGVLHQSNPIVQARL
eukprot:386723-Pelagomonas_calceolata.AAC.5